MKLVLFRHGERENSGTSNPPLSLRGQQQAKNLADLVRTGRLPRPQRLICSPKLRTHMTFQELAMEFQLPLQIRPELDEQMPLEDRKLFFNRIKSTLNGLNSAATPSASDVTFMCSHVDWLEAAMRAINCDTDLTQERYVSCWAPGHFMVFDITHPLWVFEKMETL